MFRRSIISLTCLLLLLLTTSGCMKWRVPKLDLNQLRDPRAIEIDSRLAEPGPAKRGE